VNGKAAGDGGVAQGSLLVAFVDAVMTRDEAALARARDALRESLSPAAFVDACAVIGAFHIVDRIADATGMVMSADVRQELDLARFASSVNSPGV
jgi:alkylhydroperoxidase family enzyme